jgi:putative oxidoreductase
MKIAALIARILLGLVFLVFGLNGFLHFIPMGPMPSGPAGQFMGALFVSHYLIFVFLLEILPAALLLANQYVPLALVLLGPIIVNIVLFHALMAPGGLPLATLAVVLWIIVAAAVRPAFAGILQRRVHV